MANEIVMYRGEDKTVQISVKYEASENTYELYSLSGATVVMYVRKDIRDELSDAYITKTGTITGLGIVEFYLVPADTNDVDLEDLVPYVTDFVATLASGKSYKVLRTTFVMKKK